MPQEPVAERLVKIVTALATEVAVLRERLDTLEKLAEKNGLVTAAEIEDFAPDPAMEQARQQWRQAYLERIFADLRAEVAAARTATGDEQ